MSEEKVEAKAKVSWPTIFSTVAGGVLLAGFTYFFALVGPYIFSDRADIYFVERPLLPNGKFQKLVVLDNYSWSLLNDIQFTIGAEGLEISQPINFDKFELKELSPKTTVIRLDGVLPNRQTSFVITSSNYVSGDSFRAVKWSIGFRFLSKDKLVESWFDWSQFLNAIIQFFIYVAISLYFDRRLAAIGSVADLRLGELREIRADVRKIEQGYLKIKLTQLRRILSLSKENRLWREAAIGGLEQGLMNGDSARRLIGIILGKAGIKPGKNLDDLAEDEMIDAIEDTEMAIDRLPRISPRLD